MADGAHPALASVTIRRLVLHGAEADPGLGDAIAAAIARELGGGGGPEPMADVAQTIARSVVGHPQIVGGSRDGEG